MNLGVCWQNGVWANGSWVEGVWCPDSPCVPVSIGECWTVSWCSGTWASSVWCPTTPPVPPTPAVTRETVYWGPSYVIYSEDEYWKRQRREEDEIIIL